MKSLGDRMKEYENVWRIYLPKRMSCIIRLDGKAFHSFTRGFSRPFDGFFTNAMWKTARKLCEEIDDVRLAYMQSDEISLLLIDYESLGYESWFNKNLQKMVSISASIATYWFNEYIKIEKPDDALHAALFDSRAFVLTKDEVCNYFLERQWDATRNSINAVGQAYFSHKELHGLNTDQIQEKLFQEKQINWNNLPLWQRRGACYVKEGREWIMDQAIPKFSEDRNFIEKYVNVGD